MNDLVPLHFEAADVRMVLRDGEAWWVLADVARLLGIKSHRNVAARLWDWQKAGVQILDASSRQRRLTTLVNEAGVYALVLNSSKPIAERFAHWLFTEVLPSIRKYGVFPPPALTEQPEPDWCDGTDKLLHERFFEERLRWEAASGMGLHEIPGFSKPVIRAIEAGLGGIDKGQRVRMLTLAGIDVLYILSGLRTVSPTERRAIAYIRESSDPRKLAFLAAISSS